MKHCSLLQYLSISGPKKNIPGRTSSAQNQYVFQASLPALGYNTYYFQAKGKKRTESSDFIHLSIADGERIEQRKVTTTINEACILQNEVRDEISMFILTDYLKFLASAC